MPTAENDGPILDLYAVVPAGGAGTRLWPLSRRSHPKFLHDLTGSGRTLLQGTWDRLVPLVTAERVVVVTGAAHAEAVARQLPGLAAGSLVAEPSPRNSMAAIGLAAAILQHRHGPVVIGSFAADHVVPDPAGFRAAVRSATLAARAGYVSTIGITPTAPSTAFGYIDVSDPLPGEAGAAGARHVATFVEKPDEETARAYLATGRHLWNAGMFVARTDVIAEQLARTHADLAEGLSQIARVWDTPHGADVLAEIWPTLTSIAIDHAIAEPAAAAGDVAVVPGDFTWDDVGDWASLAALLPEADDGVRRLGSDASVTTIASPGALVVGLDRPVAIVGLPDAVVVDTGDAILVTTREHAQSVKSVVDALAERGSTELL